jgi:hypothetical protein
MKGKLALIGTLLIIPVMARAGVETVKLTCELQITTHHPYGDPTPSQETAGVEMQFDSTSGFKAIVINSLAIPVSVANSVGGSIASYKDLSDESRWEISNERMRDGIATSQWATIDRNTGLLSAYIRTTVSTDSELVEAHGACSKVDTSKRKF